MIRVRLAAWLLRRAGTEVEYVVRRIDTTSKRRTTGTALLFTSKLKEARAKYRKARAADTDRVVITVTAVVASRNGITTQENNDA